MTGPGHGRGPLAGVRVVDLGTLLPGPMATLHLAHLGADVVKVEPPGGDPARRLYDGAFFDLVNRGKRSVVLDLRASRADREVATRLCTAADVVVVGFRPGVAERLGVGAARLRRMAPEVVHCAISGFGQDDPRGGHDLGFVARSGALRVPGSWSGRDRPPTRPAIPLADVGAADAATQAILAALYARSRGGGGTTLDIAMQEVALHWTALRAPQAVEGRVGDHTRLLDPANDVYATSDGWLAVAAVETHLWGRLCAALAPETPELADAGDWAQPRRRANANELARLLAGRFARGRRDEWVKRLQEAGVPADPVLEAHEAYTDPWVRDRGLVRDGWIRPPIPSDVVLARSPELDADGEQVRLATDGPGDGWPSVD